MSPSHPSLPLISPIPNSDKPTPLPRFHPIFLGGINVGSGNKPPWTLPAKAAYGPYDLKRAIKHFESPMPIKSPPFFPILSILVRLSPEFTF